MILPLLTLWCRFAPVRGEDLVPARLGKKDRDRDITLAMLAPDIIESDPQVSTVSFIL